MHINEGQHWIINSDHALKSFVEHITSEYHREKYLVLKWEKGKQRSMKQNSALHTWCRLLAEALNDAGWSMEKVLTKKASIDWTMYGVKEHLWKPVQESMTGESSTTKPEKVDYIKIYEVLNKHLSEKLGVHVPWPVREPSDP